MLNKFLEFLFDSYENLWIEVRRIAPPSQRFFAVEDITGVEQDAEGDTNVFVGVLPRTRKGGKAEDVVSTTDILWADIDKKTGATFGHILSTGGFPDPNVILDSGHGWHLYWRLDEIIPVAQAQELMGNIAYVLGGDAVGDPARIMRLPDTLNSKEGMSPIRVRILRFDTTRTHRPADFHVENKKERILNRASLKAKGKMNGVKTRSEELFAIAVDGVLHGQSYEQIKQRMKDDPAGSKLDEMPSRRREEWIKNALKSARQITSRRQQN